MIKAALKIFVALTLLFSAGCATTVKVKLLKPAEINLGARKKIAVLNFDMGGNIHRVNYSLYYNESYNKNKPANSLIQHLLNNRHYAVVEREQLNKIISEQSLSASGFVNKDEAIKLGKLFGVDALIVGSGEYEVRDTVSRDDESKVYPDKTVNYTEAKLDRKVTVSLQYRIIDTATGEIIAARTLHDSRSDDTPAFPEKGTEKIVYNAPQPGNVYSDPFKQPAVNNNTASEISYYDISEKMASLTEWQNMADEVVEGLTRQIVYQIAPYYVEEDKEIKDGESKTMKEALEFSKKGLWANAKDGWETVINDSSAEALKDRTAALYNLATYHEINGELEKAENYFSEAYKNSGDEKYLKDKSRIQQRQKEVEILKAQGRQQDLETTPKDVNYLEQAAKFYQGGEAEKAINAYNAALAKEPSNAAIHYNLGMIYQEQKKADKAIIAFNKATQLNPRYAEAFNQLGKLYGEAGKLEESVDAFKKAYAINPALSKTGSQSKIHSLNPVNKAAGHTASGLKYFAAGNYKEATEEYKLALENNKNDAAIHNNLAIAYYMQGKFPEAASHYKEAIRLNPEDASKYYNLALLYHNQGKMSEASEQYRKACELGFKPACDIVKENKF